MPTEDWDDRELHYCKRQLSVYEKRSLINTGGRAVIFPGTPNTEVEELIAVGYESDRIHCLEERQDRADRLYEHYLDQVSVHWEEASEWLARVHGSFSYVHLDYTGHLHDREIDALDMLRGHLDKVARVRITVARTRRLEDQYDFEHRHFHGLINRWLPLCPGGEALRSILESGIEDTTITLSAIVLCSFMFGLNPYKYMDQTANNGPYLPDVDGTHRINSLRRFEYQEPYGKHAMFSVWFDLVPLPDQHVRSDRDWVAREVVQVLAMCRDPLPPFNSPGLFGEYR